MCPLIRHAKWTQNNNKEALEGHPYNTITQGMREELADNVQSVADVFRNSHTTIVLAASECTHVCRNTAE